MSKLKAALITAVIGSSTAAMASPSLSFSADGQFSWGTSSGREPVVREHGDRYAPPTPAVYQPNRGTSWISLAQPLHLEYGRDTLQTNLRGDIEQVRLQAASGMTYIQKVRIRFRNGGTQIVNVNRWLTSRSPMLQFDLQENMGIDSLTVIGSAGSYNASYQVFAQAQKIQFTPPAVDPYLGWQRDRLPYEQQPAPAPVQMTPVQIASELTFAGTLGFRQFPVQMPASSIPHTLRLEGHGGPLSLTRVIVSFADGTSQQINNINRTLAPGEVVDLKLKGYAAITELVVYSNDSMTPVNTITGSFMISAF